MALIAISTTPWISTTKLESIQIGLSSTYGHQFSSSKIQLHTQNSRKDHLVVQPQKFLQGLFVGWGVCWAGGCVCVFFLLINRVPSHSHKHTRIGYWQYQEVYTSLHTIHTRNRVIWNLERDRNDFGTHPSFCPISWCHPNNTTDWGCSVSIRHWASIFEDSAGEGKWGIFARRPTSIYIDTWSKNC